MGSEFTLSLPVPARAEGSQVFEHAPDCHPRIKRHIIGHISEPRFHRHLILSRVEPENIDRSGRGLQQVEQALDRGGLAGAVAPEKAVTLAALHPQAQIIYRRGTAISSNQVGDLDYRHLGVHACSFVFSW